MAGRARQTKVRRGDILLAVDDVSVQEWLKRPRPRRRAARLPAPRRPGGARRARQRRRTEARRVRGGQGSGVQRCLEGMGRARTLTLVREIPPLASFQYTGPAPRRLQRYARPPAPLPARLRLSTGVAPGGARPLG